MVEGVGSSPHCGHDQSFQRYPGCLGVGDTDAEAKEDGRRAVIAVLDALKAIDRPPPKVKGAGA